MRSCARANAAPAASPGLWVVSSWLCAPPRNPLCEVVEPRFPEGFTLWRVRGRWDGGNEGVMILEIVRPYDLDLDRRVLEIADEYRRRFHQEAVLRVTMPARMELIAPKLRE